MIFLGVFLTLTIIPLKAQESVIRGISGTPDSPILYYPTDTDRTPLEVTFQWYPANGADTYQLLVDTEFKFNNPVIDQSSITDTFFTATLPDYGTQYYWKVVAVNNDGQTSSADQNFLTMAAPPPPPSPLSPANDSSGLSIPVTLKWDTTYLAIAYRLQVATDTAFNSIVLDADNILFSTDSMQLGDDLLNDLTTYYWRINSTNNEGTTGNWSNTYSFRTIGSPQPVTLIYPEDDTTNIPINVTFKWRKGVPQTRGNLNTNAISNYQFELYLDSLTTVVTIDNLLGANDTTKTMQLQNGTDYYWRVRAQSDVGWGEFSELYKFTTIVAPPATPELLSPSHNATNVSVTPTLVWNNADRAEKYHIMIATNPDFQNPVLNDSSYTFNSRNVTLDFKTQYWWKVKSKNVGGESNWSATRIFTTIIEKPTIPNPVTPANGANKLIQPIVFKWRPSERATTYDFDIATDAGFTSIAVTRTGLTDTTVTIGSLQNRTTFYWRVRSTNVGGSSAYSIVRQFRTIGVPEKVVLTNPSSGAINQPVDITFEWNVPNELSRTPDDAQSILRYHFELTTDTTTVEIVDSSVATNSKEIQGLQNLTQYFWRVRAENEAGWGAFSSWTPFTTIISTPAAPSLVSPANDSLDAPITLTFRWTTSLRAETYRLQFSTDSLFSVIVYEDSLLTDTARTVTLPYYDTQYYWRVRAENIGGASTFSNTRRISTIIQKPAIPVLLVPKNGKTHVAQPMSIVWGKSPRAVTYQVQVATDLGFTNVIVDSSNIADTSLSLPNLQNKASYFWKVRATNRNGTTAYSDAFVFRTLGLPNAVTIVNPANNAVNVSVDPLFTWRIASEQTRSKGIDDIHSIQNYLFELTADTLQATPTVVVDSTVTDTSKKLFGLQHLTKYYWRVKALNQVGWGPYTDWKPFTTVIQPPAIPELISVPDNQTNVSITPTLVWSKSERASSYQLQVSRDTVFTNPLLDIKPILDTTRQVTLPDYSVVYNWRVRAVNAGGNSAWTDFWSFETVMIPPEPPVIVSPANMSVGVIRPVTFKWSPSATASSYTLQIATDIEFNTIVSSNPSIVDTFATIEGLSPYTTYYWRVSASNIGGSSSYSGGFQFKTLGFPLTVSLVSPINGKTNANSEITFVWETPSEQIQKRIKNNANSPETVLRYWFELTADTTEAMPTVLQDTTLSDTAVTVSDLQIQTTYFWRVRARNESGWGPFSAYYNVTTLNEAPAAPVLYSPSNNATKVSTLTKLQWYSASLANNYHLQVAADTAFTNIITEIDTLRDTLYTVQSPDYETTYFWRVRSKNIIGTSDWSSVWKYTTTIDSLNIPDLLTPADSATGIVNPVTLSWGKSFQAISYRVRISDNKFFSPLLLDSTGITETSLLHDIFEPGNTYYWQVQASSVDRTTNWSDYRIFTMKNTPVAPAKVFPQEGERELHPSFTFVWNSPLDSDSDDRILYYWLEVTTDTTLAEANIMSDSLLSDTSYTIDSLLTKRLFYWRIAAQNDAGWSNFSSWTYFGTITDVPEKVFLISPSNNGNGILMTDTLRWFDTPRTYDYRVQVSYREDFGNIIYDLQNVRDTAIIVNFPLYDTDYFWRVQASNELGDGSWSSTWRFTTLFDSTLIPDLLTPSNNEEDVVLPITFRWGSVDSASYYQIQISRYESFEPPEGESLLYDEIVVQTRATVDSLPEFETLYWRVLAARKSGPGPFCLPRSFTILGRPNPVNLQSPANNTEFLPLNPKLIWNSSENTDSYRVLVSSSSGFPTDSTDGDSLFFATLAVDTTITDTSFRIERVLKNNRFYYWQIVAKNKAGESRSNQVWFFTTEPHPLPAPTELSADASEPGRVYLAWSDNSENETGFVVQKKLGDTTAVMNAFISMDTLGANSTAYIDRDIEDLETYTYRVIAVNADTSSEASNSVSVETTTVLRRLSGTAEEYKIIGNFPNPFNPATTIEFSIKETSIVRIFVYSITGERVAVLLDGELNRGIWHVSWVADRVASGVYIYSLYAQSVIDPMVDYKEHKKMILSK